MNNLVENFKNAWLKSQELKKSAWFNATGFYANEKSGAFKIVSSASSKNWTPRRWKSGQYIEKKDNKLKITCYLGYSYEKGDSIFSEVEEVETGKIYRFNNKEIQSSVLIELLTKNYNSINEIVTDREIKELKKEIEQLKTQFQNEKKELQKEIERKENLIIRLQQELSGIKKLLSKLSGITDSMQYIK
jgi:hypothetical protein